MSSTLFSTVVWNEDPNEPLPTRSSLPLTKTGGFLKANRFTIINSFMEYFNSHAGTIAWQGNHTIRFN